MTKIGILHYTTCKMAKFVNVKVICSCYLIKNASQMCT